MLDRRYTGLVLALDASFQTTVEHEHGTNITVISPQFEDGLWIYKANATELETLQGDNQFVYITLLHTLQFISDYKSSDYKSESILGVIGLRITIQANDAFYSNLTASPIKPLMKNVRKTGLGSSAAMVTSLVASLLIHFLGFDLSIKNLTIIDRLAHLCHCIAQGKVGSGFDISAAVFGSQVFRRGSPNIIQKQDEGQSIMSMIMDGMYF